MDLFTRDAIFEELSAKTGKLVLSGLISGIIPDEILLLTHLITITIKDSKCSAIIFPENLGSLTFLKNIHIHNTLIEEIPQQLYSVTSIANLCLGGNLINSLNADILKLHSLRRINLVMNQITEIPKELFSLSKLQELYLANNQIKFLHKDSLALSNVKSFDITGNKIKAPREALKGRGVDVIQYILDFQEAKNKKPLHEAKLIFIGSGDVGKTSLIKMITRKKFNNNESKTDGIEITDWSVRRGKDKIKIHIWDFGGQEIMHATHKFFMTSRSVYVLVVNPRTQDNYGNSEIEYWLKLVRSYAGDVPVVIAINKCEVHKANIAKGQITDKYDNVLGFIETSCSKKTGIEELKLEIHNAIGRLEFIDDQLPQSYFDIKLRLEATNKDYIEFEEYERICSSVDPDFKKGSQIALVRLLHDLGVMLNFSDNRVLRNTQVLNPEWVTRGVYEIINYPALVDNKGILNLSDLPLILDSTQYPTEKEQLYIADIMGHFELSFQMEGKQDIYFVPGTFPKDKPEINWPYSNGSLLKFEFKYDILPNSITSRFIVKSHRLIRGSDFWLNGVVLSYENCEALVITDPQERTIKIEVGGNGNRRTFLSIIREKFDEVHSTYKDIDIQGYVSLDPEGTILVSYYDLLAHEEAKEQHIFIPKLKTRFNVKTLLDGIEEETHRIITPVETEHDMKGASIFISYSHKDETLKDKLKAHLSTLKRNNLIRVWDDRQIIPGQEFDKEIAHYLESSDIILLLISSDFINSDYCYSNEMTNAVQRHNAGEAIIIPVIIRSCDWTDTPFKKLTGLPKDGLAVTSWLNEDEAFTNIAQGIKKAIEVFLKS